MNLHRIALEYFLLLFLVTSQIYAEPAKNTFAGNAGSTLKYEGYGSFNEPWAMTFLPGGDLLVTEKPGVLLLIKLEDRSQVTVKGVPDVAYGGQGGLGDIILHPQFEDNHLIYLSYAEKGSSGKRGAVVARAQLHLGPYQPKLENFEIIWRQTPKVSGKGHYSHRLVFGPQGYLFITSGERQKQEPAQSWTQDLGKVIRLNDDGSVPPDNPFQNNGMLAKSFWTLGHRNLLGIAFDQQGQLWTHEMGPQHGDEFNLIIRGDNYGWPLVSWGNHYSGYPIPDHDTRPDFHTPEAYWVPTIAPSGLIIYTGSMFAEWQGNALIGGLRSESLVRVKIKGDQAEEVERFDMKERIREVEQGPDGAIWVLEDGDGGRLLRLSPDPGH
ncbi:MAG: PQQ-dependent sugar dehydrogenase [Candidatus Marinimicrobia bacterium]|nr:PQQ-dependent sugar dehydrogenase [Candidatus Neomarinimicrobiota bacterium]MBT3575903.1 PQQ-dependent sugar dehydrogenase [Candidatus Neomarinimicrobiota bacterium]MBT3679400.1 PQQ-dependent sugar dehydrogenase [Candidatus Neomarinimicrobiota bacterium]MBT3951131.1 PQQ-dependent sugar dehydrogenase [Candidatus Neomarinimicrobiota bacterium]MBT4254189.1 PQQ-dependent sugar dehydrogenase [Candidatus Neomarinimicrobiota bacterium]